MMWIIFFWFLPILNAQEVQKESIGSLTETKCVHAAERSHFDAQSETCYIRTRLDCSMVKFHTPLVREQMSQEVERAMQRRGVLRKGETRYSISDNICAFRANNLCGEFEQNGKNCYMFGTDEKSWSDAEYACNVKGSHLFVPHNDEDIQNALEVLPRGSSNDKFLYWIGTVWKNNGWVQSDGSVVDFFRWAVNRIFSSDNVIAVALQSDEHGTYGYSLASPSTDKNRYICHRPATSAYQVSKTVTPITTTTTTTTTTTEPCPSHTAIKAMIRNDRKIMMSTYNYARKYYQYTMNFNEGRWATSPFKFDGGVGFLVNAKLQQTLKRCCPDLKELTILQRKTEPKINKITRYPTNDPHYYTKANGMYCATKQGYCGANFELVEIEKKPRLEMGTFYPIKTSERARLLAHPWYKDRISRVVCWIWHV